MNVKKKNNSENKKFAMLLYNEMDVLLWVFYCYENELKLALRKNFFKYYENN